VNDRRAIATRALLTAPAILAIAVLVLNDHVLKARFGGWWTGKLSDVAGLAVFPLLIGAAIELSTGRSVGRRGVAIAAASTGAVFAAIKLWAPAAALYRGGLATLQWPFRALGAIERGDALPAAGHVQLTMDPTDLLALPALGIAVWLAGRTCRALDPGQPRY